MTYLLHSDPWPLTSHCLTLPFDLSTLTMEELLAQLTKKVRIECEESHRQYVFALNGLAALAVLKEQVRE